MNLAREHQNAGIEVESGERQRLPEATVDAPPVRLLPAHEKRPARERRAAVFDRAQLLRRAGIEWGGRVAANDRVAAVNIEDPVRPGRGIKNDGLAHVKGNVGGHILFREFEELRSPPSGGVLKTLPRIEAQNVVEVDRRQRQPHVFPLLQEFPLEISVPGCRLGST